MRAVQRRLAEPNYLLTGDGGPSAGCPTFRSVAKPGSPANKLMSWLHDSQQPVASCDRESRPSAAES